MRAAPTPRVASCTSPRRSASCCASIGARRLALDPRPGDRRRHVGGAVASLFLWVYGWVGVAMLSALVRPSGSGSTRSRPSTTCSPGLPAHGSASRAGRIADLPRGVRVWPAVVGLMFFIWLELVAVRRDRHADRGPRRLHGPHARAHGPVRPRPVARPGRDVHRLVPDAEPARGLRRRARRDDRRGPRRRPGRRGPRRGRRRPPSSAARSRAACSTRSWEIPRVALVAIGTASIIFDGLSQTVAFATVFGDPALRPEDADPDRVPGRDRRAPRSSSARAVSSGAIGAGLTADRRRLPRRPLPHLPARRRPADRHRRLRPAPAGRGPVRHGVLPARQRVPAAGARLDRPARRRRGRAHARRVGGSRARHSRTWRRSPPREAAAGHAPPQDPAARRRHSRTSGSARCRWRS